MRSRAEGWGHEGSAVAVLRHAPVVRWDLPPRTAAVGAPHDRRNHDAPHDVWHGPL